MERRGRLKPRLTTRLHSLDQGTYRTPSQMTVREYLSTWYRDHVETGMAPTTIERVDLLVRIVQGYLGDMTLSALQALPCPGHVSSRTRSGASGEHGAEDAHRFSRRGCRSQ